MRLLYIFIIFIFSENLFSKELFERERFDNLSKEISKNDQNPILLSAFFGLDNALPFRLNRVCLGAWRKDGMPVIMSHTI